MRSEKHHVNNKRRWVSVLLVFLVLIGAAAGYTYYQYNQGINQSIKKINKTKQQTNKVVYTFEGKKDQYGDTNILLLGSDARGNEKSRADTIMIAHYNETRGTYKLTSIMRDIYINIPGHGKHKVNSAFAYGGPELMRQTIKENFDIDLQYYAIVDFQGFVQLIDEAFPKGVEINVEKKMSEYIGVTLEPGLQRLDGEHLLGYVRFRHDAIGDFGRVKRQQEALKAVGNQLKSIETIPKLPKLIGVITPFINTNMDTTDMLFMAKDFFSKNRGNVETLRIPIDNSFTDQRIKGEGAVLDINLEKNKEAFLQFISK
ncbi:LCP family protein [Neobacillus ginsengisoli]|uniref:Regulatory protein MsrR n=1 Tax=Neobacillus ginsengisoli TaxID=904295 RepID=A0ABT9XRE7_9BACI|nr:LCP family protein [Neobacillus ginsengisoli]MDQ0198130.1 LCP family protein required for cell wall assembly [Neobacillus ginsengisoli]